MRLLFLLIVFLIPTCVEGWLCSIVPPLCQLWCFFFPSFCNGSTPPHEPTTLPPTPSTLPPEPTTLPLEPTTPSPTTWSTAPWEPTQSSTVPPVDALGLLTTDSKGYMAYYKGTLPIVITAPHGGLLEPDEIPDRNCWLNWYCYTTNDRHTQEIAVNVAKELYALTGCHAHLVLNLLNRKKLDANRDRSDAADDLTAKVAWDSFHSFIETARAAIDSARPGGLLVDIHGHQHWLQRIELGYAITAAETRYSDATLDSDFELGYIDTTIRSLVESHDETLSEVLRGPYSFGSFLEDEGYGTVPSPRIPSVGFLHPYWDGGYIVQRHGSMEVGETVDAIQIELNSNLRNIVEEREVLAKDMAAALVQMMERWYLEPGEELCGMTGTV